MRGLCPFRQAAACIVAPAGGKPRILCACNIRLEGIANHQHFFAVFHPQCGKRPVEYFARRLRSPHAGRHKHTVKVRRKARALQPSGLHPVYPVGHHGQRGNFGQFLQNFLRAGVNICPL